MKRINIYTVRQVRESSRLYDLNSTIIGSPEAAAEVIEKVFSPSEEAVEVMGILTLNTKNKLIGAHIISMGALDTTLVHPREVFKPAILNNAAHIIVWHNHPSGDCAPSKEDLDVTQRLVDAGKPLGIKVTDHIVTGENQNYFSFAQKSIAPF